MNNKQLMSYLTQGLRNLSEPPIHLSIGELAFCSTYAKAPPFKDSPFWAIILDKQLGSERTTLFLVQYPDGESAWTNAEFFWTKEQVARILVGGPKGKKGHRKYKRVMRRINNPTRHIRPGL